MDTTIPPQNTSNPPSKSTTIDTFNTANPDGTVGSHQQIRGSARAAWILAFIAFLLMLLVLWTT